MKKFELILLVTLFISSAKARVYTEVFVDFSVGDRVALTMMESNVGGFR